MAISTSLVVEITANNQKLQRALDSSLRSIGGFAKSAARHLLKIGTLLATGLTAGAAAGLAGLNKVASEIDAIAKSAHAFGLSVKDLQQIQFLGELGGVEAGKITAALDKMQDTIGAAAIEGGALERAFTKLNLSSRALQNMDTAQQFFEIGEALNAVSSQSEKVALARDIFGRSGTAILNVFSQDINKLKQQFDALGGGISDTAAAAVEEFDDSKTKLNLVFTSLAQNITANVAPAFDVIINKVLQTVAEMGGLKQVGAEVAKSIVQNSIAMIQAFDGVRFAVAQVASLGNKAAYSRVSLEILQMERTIQKMKDRGVTEGVDAGDFFGKTESLKSIQMRLEDKQKERNALARQTDAPTWEETKTPSDILTSLQKLSNNLAKQAEVKVKVEISASKDFEAKVTQASGDNLGQGSITDSSGKTMTLKDLQPFTNQIKSQISQ